MRPIDTFSGGESQQGFLFGLDRNDPPLPNRDSVSFQNSAFRLDRNDPARCNQRVDVFHSLMLSPGNTRYSSAREVGRSIACEVLRQFG